MKSYELTCLISPELSEAELNSFQEKIISLLQEKRGILLETGRPAKKQLFSPIKKRNQGILLTLNFQLEPNNLEDMEKKLKAENQILRYMVLAKKPSKPEELIKRTQLTEKPKQKVELGEIEKKLEEILGE